jgi:hypothetical protein
MASSNSQMVVLCIIGILLLAGPANAFGAGNIGSTSKIEGQNWRHGDLEDTLLTIIASRAMGGKKFGKLDVKRVSRTPCYLITVADRPRSTSAIGFATTLKPWMSGPSSTSVLRPYAFCYGF